MAKLTVLMTEYQNILQCDFYPIDIFRCFINNQPHQLYSAFKKNATEKVLYN